MTRRIAIAVLLVGIAIALWMSAPADRLRARAAAPVVGDVWTVDVHRWKRVASGTSLLRFGRVTVTGLASEGVLEVHACDSTADERETIEDGCAAYPIELPPVPRADVLAMVDDGRIVAIDGSSDPWRALRVGGLIVCALALALDVAAIVLAARRGARGA